MRALYDNLNKNEAVALSVHRAVCLKAQDGWRSNRFKLAGVRNSIKAVLDDDPLVDSVLELVKNQNEY